MKWRVLYFPAVGRSTWRPCGHIFHFWTLKTQIKMDTIVDRSTAVIKDIDQNAKNKFKWNRLEETDYNGDFLSDLIRKSKESVKCVCIWCQNLISYGASGKKDLKNHA
jgi:hypothetical protein